MAVDMRLAVKPLGRPRRAAVIDLSDDEEIERRNTFFRLCRSLSYGEITDLANGLELHRSTVERWHYGLNYPDPVIAKAIIKWYRNGKQVQYKGSY